MLTDTELSKFDRFSIIKAIPENQRFECPQCEYINFKSNDSSNIPNYDKNHKNIQSYCYDCAQIFNLINWKYLCSICGKCYCYQCLHSNQTIVSQKMILQLINVKSKNNNYQSSFVQSKNKKQLKSALICKRLF